MERKREEAIFFFHSKTTYALTRNGMLGADSNIVLELDK